MAVFTKTIRSYIALSMKNKAAAKTYFTKKLLAWHEHENTRSLPWKEETDPYKIWLSEIILQQTRAQQGLPYYNSFTTAFPNVAALATANDEDVFRLWQGLGYYNRCKNMLATARYIHNELNDVFPDKYNDLLSLKGVGPYTAAAIASFAFNLPHAVVDGNVYRVLSRFFAIDTPFDTTQGKKQFAELAQELIKEDSSAAYNQAIMDLGATVCTPSTPLCDVCPLMKNCIATSNNLIEVLPVRSKKVLVKNRYFNYLMLIHDKKIWIQKRGSGDIWENLHQPFLIETDSPLMAEQVNKIDLIANNKRNIESITADGTSKQRLTHQMIHTNFYTVNFRNKPNLGTHEGFWVSLSEINKLAFPKTLVSFFKNNLYFYN